MQNQKRDKGSEGLLIPAGLFIGMGIGFWLDRLLPGTLIGLGVGFLAMAILKLTKK